MTKVKICGLKSKGHVEVAVRAGADFIGFMFAPSKRRISVEEAIHLATVVPKHIKKVGVFVNEAPETIVQIAQKVGLDYIQYHGDETPEEIEAIGIPAIKAFTVHSKEDVLNAAKYNVDFYLFDAPGTDYRGGSGNAFDWTLLADMKIPLEQVILAGGLHEKNVAHAITLVEPFAVDVSSGVEINGQKDAEAMTKFIGKVKGAFIR